MRNSFFRNGILGLVLAVAAAGCGSDDTVEAAEGSKESATGTNTTAHADAGQVGQGEAGYETKCTPACAGAKHCELLLQDCAMSSCPWIPTCVEGIDPCATVSCPEVCVVGKDHRHRCVELP